MAIKRHEYDYAGVYQLENRLNGKRYVGSSVRMWRRFLNHKVSLKIQSVHRNYFLQKDWDEYGDMLLFKVLEFCKTDKLREREQYWIDELSPEYNISKSSLSCKGVKRREETKAKMRLRTVSDETKIKLSSYRKGKSSARKGVKLSNETIEKLRIANTGKTYSNETNAKKGRKGELHNFWGTGKAVIQYGLDGSYINEFSSCEQAVHFLGHIHGGSNIRKCCDKKIHKAYGYKWEYKV